MTGHHLVLLFLLVLACTSQVYSKRMGKKKKARNSEFCAVFWGTVHDARVEGPAYAEIDEYDMTGDIDISMDVLPDRADHNGILFAIGSEGYKYFEWGTKAKQTQFLVVEFSYSALGIIVKASGQERLYSLELYRTYPEPYAITDGQWHHIQVIRDTTNGTWTVIFDDHSRTEEVIDQTDISLESRPATIGGREDFEEGQFNGVIKNLHVNGQKVSLRNRPIHERTEIDRCNTPTMMDIQASILKSEIPEPIIYRRPPPHRGNDIHDYLHPSPY